MQKIYETSARKGFYVEIHGIYKPKEINRVLRNCISFFKLKKIVDQHNTSQQN